MTVARPRLAGPVGGILLMTVATLVFAVQDGITKTLIQDLPVAEIVFIRFAAFLAFALAFAARKGGVAAGLRSNVPLRQIVRCLLQCGEIALFAFGLRYLGIAEMHAIFACFPLFVAALSVPVLGEAVGLRRWLAVVVGLAGTLIILRPGSGVFDPMALLALACAVIYALYLLLTRQVSRRDRFPTSLVYFGLVGTFASGAFAFFHWQPPDSSQLMLLAALCMTSICGHMMLIKALQLTEAVVLQPFHYLILPWAVLIGWFLYGERLDAATFVGAAIVVTSGVYVAWREYVLAR